VVSVVDCFVGCEAELFLSLRWPAGRRVSPFSVTKCGCERGSNEKAGSFIKR
jgi:hypothetical protein